MIPYRDNLPVYRFPIVNYILIIINIAVFIFQVWSGFAEALFLEFAMIPSVFWRDPVSNWYRPFSSMFMHGGWGHIIGNMLFLWIMGDNVEDVLGHFRYFLFYMVAGLIGTFVQASISFASPVPMVGASAAISGVIVLFFIFFPKVKVYFLLFFILPVGIPAFLFIFFWILTQFLNGLGSLPYAVRGDGGGVAYLAHIGGIIYGFFYGLNRGRILKLKWMERIKRQKID
jgi:membrane associated rhomboid family serine protease